MLAERLVPAHGVPDLDDVGAEEIVGEPGGEGLPPLGDLVGRYARTHGPFVPSEVADRLGLGVAVVTTTIARLVGTGRIVTGEFRPGGVGQEWCDADVLRSIRRRSLAKLRQEVEPVPTTTLARYTPSWQSVGSRMRGVDGVLAVVEQLADEHLEVRLDRREDDVRTAELVPHGGGWAERLGQ